MLQQVEYDPIKFWAWRTDLIRQSKSVKSVMHRKVIVYTSRAKILLLFTYITSLVSLGLTLIFIAGGMPFGYILLAFALWVVFTAVFFYIFLFWLTALAYLIIVRPEKNRLLKEATEIFAKHKAIKIAVLGSYGKTTCKEILNTVLSESKKVATTPGNMNVSVSHARFARKLTGDENIIIVEFGEGEPGDIGRMASMLKPDYAIITGLAPNHLDHYADLSAVAADLLDIYKFVDSKNVFVSGESKMLKKYLAKDAQLFTVDKTLDWQTKDINISVSETSFSLVTSSKTIRVKSSLLGRHQVAPLSCVAVLAFMLGVSIKDIEAGLSKTKPYDHRMQPRLVQGAWLIDDTYNGNLEGLQAGLKLLSAIPAKRRWYVTPGLVDQGSETETVHKELGKLIAQAKPDIVVLMENSARASIQKAMEENGFKGELRVENNPLDFYTNIEHLVAVGDVVLMQNDWTDNYS